MYSLSTRLNAVFFYFVMCLAALCVFNFSTAFLMKGEPSVIKFEITKFTSLYDHFYTKVQHSNGQLDMQIDFSPCFNWNNNLVFAWITATYKTGKDNKVKISYLFYFSIQQVLQYGIT